MSRSANDSGAAIMPTLTHTLETDDGVSLTYYEHGGGRPLVLLHGYNAPAMPTWLDTGIAERLASDGHRVIMPDLRGHGSSVPSTLAYPRDALVEDLLTLIARLELGEYDLGGYSLGARIVARALTAGATPRRAFIGGTGLEPILHAAGRGENYRRILSNLGTWEAGTPEAQFEGWVRQVGADPEALIRILDTFADTSAEDLAQVQVPTLIIAGDQDADRGSVEDLAAILPNGNLKRIPGDHFTALTSPELATAITNFLGDDDP
jgi:pimeloyl-ACP methyl ester carboxylesterase